MREFTFSGSRRVLVDELIVHVEGPCNVTGEVYKATYPKTGVVAWLMGAHIQDAMPDVSDGDREFLISGISPAGWDRLFAESGE